MDRDKVAKRHMNFKRNSLFRKEILQALKQGKKTTAQLYEVLKRRCPEHCDDREKCTHYAVTKTYQPEWKHQARRVLDSMQKEFLIYYDKLDRKWKIVE
jgi:spore coat protein CotF